MSIPTHRNEKLKRDQLKTKRIKRQEEREERSPQIQKPNNRDSAKTLSAQNKKG